MAMRIVMVEFISGITEQDIAEFKGWLYDLASRSSDLVRMTCGVHYPAQGDAELSVNAPSVVFGNFVSIWEFTDERALNDFVTKPFHHEMAGKNFRRLVKRRYVTNIP